MLNLPSFRFPGLCGRERTTAESKWYFQETD